MPRSIPILIGSFLLAGCGGPTDEASKAVSTSEALVKAMVVDSPPPESAPPPPAAPKTTPLVEARRGFTTKLTGPRTEPEPVPPPPPDVFRLVRYDSPVGKLPAYLTPDPGDGRKHPAIVWITGGDCNTINELWGERPRENDQTASAYRKAGIVLMFPSLRGGNDNPGRHEAFLGEVDDVLAAVDFLAHQPYIDPARIYLGGHSTGGTLVMLVAESTDRLRAVFSFGPASDVSGYPDVYTPFDKSNPKEVELRSPGRWLDSVRCPLFVFEGTENPCNIDALQAMAAASKNPMIRFLPVKGVNHFSILGPVNERLAARILDDDGPKTRIALTEQELNDIGR